MTDPAALAILEYQWPSTAILNTPVPLLSRSIIWVVFSMVVSLIIVMGIIPLDQVVTARGIVVSKSPNILVQPLETSIVRSIEVREGQRVRAGDMLARLDPTFAAADLGTLSGQMSSLEIEVARLEAEASGRTFAPAEGSPDTQLQATLFDQRRQEFEAKVQTYDHKLDELRTMWARALSDAAAYRERLAVAKDVEKMRRDLEAKQVGARINTLAAVDNRAEVQRALSNAEKTAEGARRDIDALEAERTGFIQNWRSDTSQKLSDARRKLSEVREQVNKARLRRDLVEMRADHDGIVQSVAKASVGSVLQPGQPFITLVPSDGGVEIEANIHGTDAGFVKAGDPVSVKFDTFPFAQFGMAEGVVHVVSPDAFTAQAEARNPTGTLPVLNMEPYFRARISIDRLAMHDIPESFRVAPGMPVTADIRIGERTMLGYLMGKIVPVAREGMREP